MRIVTTSVHNAKPTQEQIHKVQRARQQEFTSENVNKEGGKDPEKRGTEQRRENPNPSQYPTPRKREAGNRSETRIEGPKRGQ